MMIMQRITEALCSSRLTTFYRRRSTLSMRCAASTGVQQVAKAGADIKKLKDIKQFIFIRHGEKTVLDEAGLSLQGRSRAANIPKVFGKDCTAPDTYNTPDIIYAMKQGKKATSSRRPFDTVAPLGVQLGMDPQMGERTGSRGENVFDAKIRRDDIDDLCDNVLKHAKDDYVDKTILTCWEHKAIPKIVYTMGLTDTELTWGLNPFSGADEEANYTAIWVFTPALVDDPKQYFKVFKMFDMVPNSCNAEGKCPPDNDPTIMNAIYVPNPPNGPYNARAL